MSLYCLCIHCHGWGHNISFDHTCCQYKYLFHHSSRHFIVDIHHKLGLVLLVEAVVDDPHHARHAPAHAAVLHIYTQQMEKVGRDIEGLVFKLV